jgi:H+/Cl- antiporter ClcA
MSDRTLLRLVVIVGAASGLIGAGYIAALKVTTELLGPDRWSAGPHIAVLVVVGAFIGALTRWVGNPGDVELLVDNIHVDGGKSDVRELRSLLPISLLGIGAGSAIGPEAPLVQTTGTLGSFVGRRHGLRPAQLRILTITGMAAGFTVLFGAPLGGAVFALEILHRRGMQYVEAIIPAAIGALAGYAAFVTVRQMGIDSVWHFPAPHRMGARDLLVGVGAGVLGAAIAAAFTGVVQLQRRVLGRVPVLPRPILGGVVLGILALASTYALTFGEEQIGDLMVAKVGIGTLLLAALCKFIATSTMMSTGWRGGFIIPLFFLGVTLGIVVSRELNTDPTITVLALMAACNVGVTKTPLGSALVVSGMAGIRVLPTTLVASIVAFLLTNRIALIESQRERVSEPA